MPQKKYGLSKRIAGSYKRGGAVTSEGRGIMKIAVVAPANRIERVLAEKVSAVARQLYDDKVNLFFHPQCYLTDGHFAGDDDARAKAFVEVANDPRFEAVWMARGGYGSNRITERVVAALSGEAKKKIYLGYSDAGFLFGGLYKSGYKVAHGPVVADIRRDGGDVAVTRALKFLVGRDPSTLEPSLRDGKLAAAFNLTVLSHMIGTPLQPDLAGHVLMLEDIDEHTYRIDRAMFHITGNSAIRKVAGIRCGRFAAIPPNEPEFGKTEEDVVKHWCALSGIPYLGRADIGHDVHNKIVPFGVWK
jgi:muramoyltetrapeptide carboxypeptidase